MFDDFRLNLLFAGDLHCPTAIADEVRAMLKRRGVKFVETDAVVAFHFTNVTMAEGQSIISDYNKIAEDAGFDVIPN